MDKFDVVAAIIIKDDKFFIAQRNRNKHMGLSWEFPGGKVEIGEENYQDDKINVKLHYFICSHAKGEIILSEHEDSAWVTKNEFKNYNFAEGDSDIINLL